MNVLISLCLSAGDAEPLLSFPTAILADSEKDLLKWIVNYYTSYGKLPTIDRLHQQFPSFINFPGITDPVADIFDQTLRRKRAELARRGLLEANEADANDASVADIFTEYGRKLQAGGNTIMNFSTFDREAYFKPRNPLFFGMPLLDRMTQGIGAGELAYLIGRLNVGKSTIAQWLATLWWQDGLRVFYASNESLPIDVFARIDAMVGGFNPLSLRDPSMRVVLEPRVKSVAHVASHSKGEIMIPQKQIVGVDDLFAQAVERRADALVVDGVYLMRTANANKSGPYWERITDVSRAIKQQALATGMRVLGLHQMKRGTGTGERKIDAEDAAYSDALGQDADFMFGIQRMEQIGNEPEKIAVEIIKNRYGPKVGTVVTIDFSTMTLKETVEFSAPR